MFYPIIFHTRFSEIGLYFLWSLLIKLSWGFVIVSLKGVSNCL